MNLKEIRQQIDIVDEQLLDLFLKRMELSGQVAQYKIKNNMPVLNREREEEILSDVSKKSGEFSRETALLFEALMDLSRVSQYKKMAKIQPLLAEPMPQKVAFAGIAGSFTESAAKNIYSHADFTPSPDFEGVFTAVADGSADRGVVPCENSFAGSVYEVYDLLTKYGLYIVSAARLSIRHNLLGIGTEDQVKTVCSHPQALNQCREFIKARGYNIKEYENTSLAARAVAELEDPSVAAIGSLDAAESYSLNVLKRDIQTAGDNTTRFISVAREAYADGLSDKVSVAFSLPHTSGSLHRALAKISACGLNLTKIESRPNKKHPFEYLFYTDFEGNIGTKDVAGLLMSFSAECKEFYFLGNYSEKEF